MKEIGKRIKEQRTNSKLSQKELAIQVGVKQNTIAQYENGTAKMSIDVLVKLADVFSCTTDYILCIKDW